MLKKLTVYFEGYRFLTVLCPLMMIIEVLMDVLIPKLMGETINSGVIGHDLSLVYRNGALMILFALIGLVCGSSSSYFGAKAGQGFGANLRLALFSKIQTFSFANLDQFETSSLITRLTNDVTRLAQIAQMTLRMAVRAPVMFVFAFIMALRVNAGLSVVFLFALPFMGLGVFWGMRRAMPRFRGLQKQLDRVNNRVQENLTAIRIVKSFVRADFENEKFEEENERLFLQAVAAFNTVILLMPFMMLVMYACIIAVLWYGGLAMLSGDMLAGDLITFILYITQILMSMMMMSILIMNYTRAKASAERVIEVLETSVDLVSPEAGVREVADGSIVFRDVTFRYPGNVHPALEQVSLNIPSGASVAVIGSTGSAKTTLVQLIPRLYDVSAGEVCVGGVSVQDYDLVSLRDQVSVVLQKNTLFSGTIRENMQWGNPRASDEMIIEALDVAQAAEFVLSRPEGLDALVEQDGANFSGGQKQRLTIARALLKQPKILILDDATSALDTQTETRLQRELRRVQPDLTKIIIAQRISSVETSDFIVVMNEGRISDIGTHDELLARDRIYQEIYESQQRGMMAV